MRVSPRLLAIACLVFLAPVAQLSAQGESRRISALPQWEFRQDVTLAQEPGVHVGAGINVRAGYYARLGATLNLGAVRDATDRWMGAQRLDLTARFLLDPFGERPHAWYGGGGISVVQRPGERASATLQLVAGLEGEQGRRITPAVELGIGGGVRLGVVLRRTRRGQAR